MQITNKEKPTRLGITIFLCFILCSALFVGFQINLKQVSGFSPAQSKVANNAATASLGAVFDNPVVKNDYIVAMITTQNGGTISSVKDTLENTFTSVISNTNTELAAIYIAKNTNKTGTDTVTVALGASQANVTLGISDMVQINSVTASVTGSGHGSATPTVELSASIQPNLGDACFATGIAASSANTNIVIPTAPTITNNYIDTGFGMLFLARSSGTAGISFGTFLDDPNATEPIKAEVSSLNPTNSAHPNLGLWEEVAACFPQNQVTTTTSVATTTTTTTAFSTTITNTTTTTGTALPEPTGSTDISIILIPLGIMVILFILGLVMRKYSWLPPFLAFFVGLVTTVQLEQAPTIVSGNNSFNGGNAIALMLILFVIFSLVLAVYNAIRNR